MRRLIRMIAAISSEPACNLLQTKCDGDEKGNKEPEPRLAYEWMFKDCQWRRRRSEQFAPRHRLIAISFQVLSANGALSSLMCRKNV